MNEFIIYPALDLRDGKVVRLRQGKGDQQTDYNSSPELIADQWISQGAEWLHVVNLNGAFGEQTIENEAQFARSFPCGKGKVKIQLGGGSGRFPRSMKRLTWVLPGSYLGTAVIENPTFGEEVLRAVWR